MEAGARDPASWEDKGRFGDTSLQTTRQGEAETRLAPWGLVEELGNERRIQRLAARDRGGKQWGRGDTGEMEWGGVIDTQAGEGEMGHSEAGQGGDSKDRDKEDWSRHGQ